MLTILSDRETDGIFAAIQVANEALEQLTVAIAGASTVSVELGTSVPAPAKVKAEPAVKAKSQRKTRASHRKGKRGIRALDEVKVLEIRRMLAEKKLSVASIAQSFGVHPTTINHIKWGKTWKQVQLPQQASNVVSIIS